MIVPTLSGALIVRATKRAEACGGVVGGDVGGDSVVAESSAADGDGASAGAADASLDESDGRAVGPATVNDCDGVDCGAAACAGTAAGRRLTTVT